MVLLVACTARAELASAYLAPPPGKPPAGWISPEVGTPAPPGVDYSAYADAHLSLVAPPRSPGQMQTNAVQSTRVCSIADGTLPQNQRFATIRNIPGGLVVGNCRGGSTVYQHGQDGNAAWGFDFVSEFNNCGWLLYSNSPLANNNPNNHCLNSPTNPALSSFMYYSNCPPSSCSDGSPAHLATNCQAYANVNPGVPHSAPASPTWVHAAGELLLWRYTTADGLWVMARHPQIASGDGNWLFYSSSCFAGTSDQFITLNPYTVTWYRGSPA
ncbi:hypothetical protein [Baekduia sp.]|jgi:hypothetical protein|uniref:hypothetical protein n=1 Tax=Baekduia sp. TaxID=2600305 RepID=UPI002E063A2C|nr:hypothetical protein [Baekduia sp.]